MSRNVRKRTFGYVRPAKIQFRLRICAVCSGSSLGAFRIAENAEFLYLDNEDSGGQTAQRADLSRRKTNKSKGTFSLVGAPLFNVIYTCNNMSYRAFATTNNDISTGHRCTAFYLIT